MCNITLEKIEEKETHIPNHHHEKHEPQEHNHKSQKHKVHQEHEEHKEHIHHDHADHHRQMVSDFKKRFIISALVTIPILLLSPLIQQLFNFRFGFLGEKYILSMANARSGP
ncbi:Copper-exporting P-type ATPase B [subsurface metagenome]